MMTGRSEKGFSLLEVMVAAVIVVILAMGLAASLGGVFLADASAKYALASANAAQRLMEELQQLDYGDTLACDGDAVVTTGGVALKVSVVEVSVGMEIIEVNACHPAQAMSAAQIAGMTMAQFKGVHARPGSQVRLMTSKARR
jgi:prepilin-type N-terminal cleavage/methylation domain-containing protein